MTQQPSSSSDAARHVTADRIEKSAFGDYAQIINVNVHPKPAQEKSRRLVVSKKVIAVGSSAALVALSALVYGAHVVSRKDMATPLAVVDVYQLHPDIDDKRFVSESQNVDPTSLGKADLSELRDRFGGIVVGSGLATFTLRNVSAQRIRITRMGVEKSCDTPVNATVFQAYTQGGGSPSNIALGIDLDQPDPVVQKMYYEYDKKVGGEVSHLAGPGYFDENTVEIDPGGMQTFAIGAVTKRFSCSFRLRVFAAADGKVIQLDVYPKEGHYRITGPAPFTPFKESPFSGYRSVVAQNEDQTWSFRDPILY